ncbi:sigma-70 family RNA polymerase sigma factor [Geomonas nitrogeniifigens]|uniref:sigma-70 family RNA polymerase sigma factor n=1 Tax=Geomonas diazotrophica TaxID=2843197 RepID=UPI001C2CA831|nr:sigma-70 family RNA polymerase sigma factor [Geomonas nitrogeniifigens]QXE87385.1 sigma-70 family RNA polymerase sigma factor [Geomonas nitrogeniifigens]
MTVTNDSDRKQGERSLLEVVSCSDPNSAEYKIALNTLVLSHQWLVKQIAYKVLGNSSRREEFKADLIQEGTQGLLMAIRKFDLERDTALSTYAKHWIHKAIVKYINQNWRSIRVPEREWYAIRCFIGEEAKSGLREPSVEEISAATGVSIPMVTAIRQLKDEVRLDEISSNNEDSEGTLTIGDMLPNNMPSAEDSLEWANDLDQIRKTLLSAGLSDTALEILRRRFGLDGRDEENVEEIGKSLGRRSEWVRRQLEQALDDLRWNFVSHGLTPIYEKGMI